MQKKKLEITIWSDLACPWCWVGKKRLDAAIDKLSDDIEVSKQWKAYMIDRNTAKNGETYSDYNQRRWGGDGWTIDLHRSGKPDGAHFSNWKWWPNTLKAHRLMALATKHNKADECKDLLFTASYEQGKNISLYDTLNEIAIRELNLPPDEVEEYLMEGRDGGLNEVLADDAIAKTKLDVKGVPFFIIGSGGEKKKRYSLSGAQGIDDFVKVFNRVLDEQKNDG